MIRNENQALRGDRLSWVSQNYLRDDTLSAANAILEAAQSQLELAQVWGGGEVASADGMRFVVPVRTVHAGPNPKYFGAGRGVTWYNLISDQFSGVNAITVPGTLRDSLVLLAVVLEQQTELQPTQIMTDICKAVDRPSMRFVPIKDIEQQAGLLLHRVRQGFVKARTAQANQIRGLLAEFGLVIPRGIAHIAKCVPELIEDEHKELPGLFRVLVQRLLEQLKGGDRQVRDIESQIVAWYRVNENSRKLAKISGVGPWRCQEFQEWPTGECLAWAGAEAELHWGKTVLLGMSKRGASM